MPSVPLFFEKNQGQAETGVLFTAHAHGYAVALSSNEARFSIAPRKPSSGAPAVVRFNLRGANQARAVEGQDKLPGVVNWYFGDRDRWREGISTYSRVRYAGVYPGIDLVYYGNENRLEFDFEVAPGADATRIAFQYQGAKVPRIDEHGDLILETPAGLLTQHRPRAYQRIGGRQVDVDARYRLDEHQQVSLSLGSYDHAQPLTIDPSVTYFAYLGGTGSDSAVGVAVHPTTGEAFVLGSAYADTGYQYTIYHMNAAGTTVQYATVLPTQVDTASGIAVNSSGEAYIVGQTSTSTLTTVHPFQAASGGGTDAVFFKLSSTGTLQVASYLGGTGTDYASAVAVDSSGNAYIAGTTWDLTSSYDPITASFPTTAGTAMATIGNQCQIGAGIQNGFVVKITASAGTTTATKAWSTLIGGPNSSSNCGGLPPMTTLSGIAVDSSGASYVIGSVGAGTLHQVSTVQKHFQMTNAGVPVLANVPNYSLAIVVKLSADAKQIGYVGYLGGSSPVMYPCQYCGSQGPRTVGAAIAVGSDGVAYVGGATQASDFQTTSDALSKTKNSRLAAIGSNTDYDAFIVKVKADGSGLLYSTFLGGSTLATGETIASQWVNGIAVDAGGNFFAAGSTNTTNFPTTNTGFNLPFSFSYVGGSADAFISKFQPSGAILWSNYVGTTGADSAAGVGYNGSDVILAGNTDTANAQTGGSPAWHGSQDIYLARLQDSSPKATTTTTGALSATASSSNQTLTFTGTVTSTVTMNSGTVTYTVTNSGGTQIGSAVTSGTVTSGSAPAVSYTLPGGTPGGTYTITAVYNQAGGFASSSGTAKLTITSPTSSTTIAVSPTSTVYGQAVTLIVTVTSPSSTPGGTVTFSRDGTAVGSAVTLDATGKATLAVTDSPVGSHSFSAAFAGGGVYVNSSSTTSASVTVGQASTTLALASSSATPKVSQTVTFTATLSVTSPGGGSSAGDTVQFIDSATSTVLGTGTLALSGSTYQATFTKSFATAGTYSVYAQYAQTTRYGASTSSAVSETVSKWDTTAALTASPTSSAVSQQVTLSATISTTGSGAPAATGTVEFFDGTTSLGTATVASTKATLQVTTLAVGSRTLSAQYAGDAGHNTSKSANLSFTVSKASSTTTLTSSAVAPIYPDQTITLTATVAGAYGGSPTGTVTFTDSGTSIGTGTLSGGKATLNLTLATGSHSISASYPGDTSFNNSATTAALSQTITKRSSSATLTPTPNPSGYQSAVTLKATVSGAGVTPTGTVGFFDGTTSLGTATLSAGVASLSVATLSISSHSLTAHYNGDSVYLTVVSSAVTQVVTKATTTTALASSANPSYPDQSVTLTATVTSAATAKPTGTVTFYDGTTSLGTGTVDSTGKATKSATFTVGSHTLKATYGGDTSFNTSTSSDLAQTSNKHSSTTVLTSSLNPSNTGQSVTLTATVTVTSLTPSGTVTFYDGTTSLGTGTLNASGVATLTTTTIPVGARSLTATYAGDTKCATSTSVVLTQTVNLLSTSVALISSANPSFPDQSITLTATVTSSGSGKPTGTVTFRDGTASIGSGTVDTTGKATASVTLAAGAHTLTATYGGDTTFATSTSSGVTQTVNKRTSTTSLTSSLNPSNSGQSITLTATVAGAGPKPTGVVTFNDGTTSLGTGTVDSNGIAMLAITSIPVGARSLTAVYSGDNTFVTSTSAVVTQTVNPTTTSVALVSSANPSFPDQSITLTATVTASGSSKPTGTVTFYDGTTSIGTGTLDATGKTTASATLAAGTHTLNATYGGDSTFGTSASPSLSQVVNKHPSTTALGSSPNPAAFGQSVTLTATVTVAGPKPTGIVTFYDGTTLLGTGTLDATGVATFSTTSLVVGARSLTAVYAGDNNCASGTSAVVTETVNQSSSSVALTSSTNPAFPDQTITLTATVTTSTGKPTGTVTFYDGTTSIGTGALDSTGKATASVTLAAGTHSLTANYGGDTTFGTSTSSSLSQVVNKRTSTTALAASPNPSNSGQSVTLTATVTVTGPKPTGTVTFYDGTTSLGTGTLDTNGVATLSTTTLAVGARSLTVVYAGDSNCATSTSPVLTQTVNFTSTGMTLGSSSNPSSPDQTVIFTAGVSVTSGIPTGTVMFSDNGTPVSTVSLDDTGHAYWSSSSLAAGTHTIGASYSGDSTYGTSAATPLSQVVNKRAATVSIGSTPNPSTLGQAVILSATVSGAGPVPAGNVEFFDGTTSLGTAALNAAGVATLNTSALTSGTHSLSANYGGSAIYLAASTSVAASQTVNKGNTTVTLQSSLNPAFPDQSVTLTATVSGGSATPTGPVTFFDGSTSIGSGTLSAGSATLTLTLAVGAHSLTVSYGGDGANSTGVSSALTETVNKRTSTTVLQANPNPAAKDQAVSLTATVTGAGASPTGSVTFYDGANTLGTATLNGAGVTVLTVPSLAMGSHSLTGAYGGDGTYSGSTSSAVAESVNSSPSKTGIASSTNPSLVGQTVTFTATVLPQSGSGIPTGIVTFSDAGTPIGTGTLNGSGTASFSTSSLVLGTHTITASYPGDGTWAASSSTALIQTVNKQTSSTSIVSSANPAQSGSSMTFTATVTGSSPAPTGTVQFFDGGTPLGSATLSGGVATFSTSSLSIGSHSIAASYSGDGTYDVSTSAGLTQVVNPASVITTTTSVGSLLNPSVYGQTVTLTATVTATSGVPSGTVTFMDGSTPFGIATLNSGTAALTVSSLAVGTRGITVVYAGNSSFGGSTSAVLSQVVNLGTTTTSVNSSANPSSVGQSVTLSVVVSAAFGGIPTGKVTFRDGSTQIGVVTLSSGTATFNATNLSGGSHSITATYGGDANFAGSASAVLAQVVNLASATVGASASVNPSAYGQWVTLTATVTGSSTTPTGTVTFFDGATNLGSAVLSGGTASVSVSTLAVGAHSITASYGGDSNNSARVSDPFTQNVSAAATQTAVVASANPVLAGASVTFTATVSAVAPGQGTPTGSVTFLDNGSPISTVPLSAGGAQFTTTLTAGSHTIGANFAGSANFASSGTTLSEVVNSSGATVTLTSSPNPAQSGQNVTITAIVTGSGSIPAGSITFLDGGTTIGTGTLSGGTVAITTATLASGSHTLTASYTSTNGYSNAVSAPLTEVVLVPVTVSTVPAGLAVLVDGAPFSGSQTFQWVAGSSHRLEVVSPQQATTTSRLAWSNWSNGGTQAQVIAVPSAATSYVANFVSQYLVSVSASPAIGGTVSGGGWYNAGTVVPISASALAGFNFAAFSGDVSSSANPANVTVNGPLNLIANFTALVPSITAAAGTRTDGTAAGTRNLQVILTNSGAGNGYSVQVAAITGITVLGGSGTVSLVSGVPSSSVTLAPGTSVSVPVLFNWPATATRVSFTLYLNATDPTGTISYPKTQTITMFR